MNEYQKINTLYKRDSHKKIIIGEFTEPEVEFLKDSKWESLEKVDGTNISLVWNGIDLNFHGRTKDAETPEMLLETLRKKYKKELFQKVFPLKPLQDSMLVEIFGEGYGVGINGHEGGGTYLPDSNDFILFDVTIDGWKLLRANCESVAKKINTNIVKLLGYYTIAEAEEIVKHGFKSAINPNRVAEGMVLKTPLGLCNRKGERIMTKIKHRDYKHLKI